MEILNSFPPDILIGTGGRSVTTSPTAVNCKTECTSEQFEQRQSAFVLYAPSQRTRTLSGAEDELQEQIPSFQGITCGSGKRMRVEDSSRRSAKDRQNGKRNEVFCGISCRSGEGHLANMQMSQKIRHPAGIPE